MKQYVFWGWVTQSKITEVKGVTADQLRGWRRNGMLSKEVHYKRVGKGIMYHMEAIDECISNNGNHVNV